MKRSAWWLMGGLVLGWLLKDRLVPSAGTYTEKPFPLSRRLVLDAGYLSGRRHMIHGLLEIDVTLARQRLRDYKAATGEKLSFTAFALACIGHAIDQNRHMHAYRNRRGKLILFDDVDATITVETEIDGQKFPIIHIMRGINKRTVEDMHAEIRTIQQNPNISQQNGFVRFFPLLPRFLRRRLYQEILHNPHLQKRYAGTVGFTSVGMFGEGSGWGLGMPVHTVAVTVGGITERPVVVEGEIVIREMMNVTLSFDHNIIDGAPAARFSERFKTCIETAYGLPEREK